MKSYALILLIILTAFSGIASEVEFESGQIISLEEENTAVYMEGNFENVEIGKDRFGASLNNSLTYLVIENEGSAETNITLNQWKSSGEEWINFDLSTIEGNNVELSLEGLNTDKNVSVFKDGDKVLETFTGESIQFSNKQEGESSFSVVIKDSDSDQDQNDEENDTDSEPGDELENGEENEPPENNDSTEDNTTDETEPSETVLKANLDIEGEFSEVGEMIEINCKVDSVEPINETQVFMLTPDLYVDPVNCGEKYYLTQQGTYRATFSVTDMAGNADSDVHSFNVLPESSDEENNIEDTNVTEEVEKPSLEVIESERGFDVLLENMPSDQPVEFQLQESQFQTENPFLTGMDIIFSEDIDQGEINIRESDVKSDTSPPLPEYFENSNNYNFELEGFTPAFIENINLYIILASEDQEQGFTAYSSGYYSSNWEELDTNLVGNVDNKPIIYLETDDLQDLVLGSHKPDINYENIELSKSNITEGEEVNISFTVSNNGKAPENHSTEIRINDEIVYKEDIELEPGQSEDLNFTSTPDLGSNEIKLGSQNLGEVNVQEETIDSNEENFSFPIIPALGLITVFLSLIGLVLVYYFNSRNTELTEIDNDGFHNETALDDRNKVAGIEFKDEI